MTPEGKIAAYLKKRIKESGGSCWKVCFPGTRGAPDYLVGMMSMLASPILIETKRPKGGKLSAAQEKRHRELRRIGFNVFVLSTKEQVDHFIKWYT